MSNKYYVVWVGRQTGIFNTWEECQKQITGYAGMKYKKFGTLEEANSALAGNWDQYYQNANSLTSILKDEIKQESINEAIITTAIINSITKTATIRAIDAITSTILFQIEVENGTLNNAKYIAIVEALKYCKEHNIDIPIYCDNNNIINWVKKYCAPNITSASNNKEFSRLYLNAKSWIQHNDYPNDLLTWSVKEWGTNPAEDI